MQKCGTTHEISKMDVAIGIEQHVIGLDIPVYNALCVDVSDSAAKLCYPEAYGILCESFPGDVETEVAAVHEINDNVAVCVVS